MANYPWDGTPDKSSRYEACPDDAAFKHLAGVYARAHATMALPTNTEFPHGGTTNGAAWYPIYGSMQVGWAGWRLSGGGRWAGLHVCVRWRA